MLAAYYLECGDRQSDVLQLYERIQMMDPYHDEKPSMLCVFFFCLRTLRRFKDNGIIDGNKHSYFEITVK